MTRDESETVSIVDDKLVPAQHSNRPPPPTGTWDYRAYGSWRDELWMLLSDLVDYEVKAAFLDRPPEYVVGDDLTWLDNIIWSVRGREVDSKSFLGRQLRRRYDALRAVHGTRTADLARFYSEGLRPLDPGFAQEQARQIFLGGAYPELTEADLARAITTVGSDLREGRVFFEANEDMLINQAGHYMLYGSEYLVAIAAHLGGFRDYRQVLKTRGNPTLFICDVPLRLVRESTLLEFAGTALEMMFQELLGGPAFEPDRMRGAGFCIREPLPASQIVGHYHPTVTRDPFRPATWL